MFISVLIPVFNGEQYLAEAIESVLAQTHRDFELIVVDDGSTDRSINIARLYECRDGRVKVIRQRNQGVSVARNTGLREAWAEWIACLDADDVMLPHRLERQIAFIAAHPDVRCFGAIAEYINAKGQACGHTVPAPIATREQLVAHLATDDLIGLNQPSVMMHRDTVLSVGGYHPEMRVAQDLDLWMRIAQAGHLVLQQNEVLTQYRVHPQSITVTWAYESHLTSEWVVARAAARREGRLEPSFKRFKRKWRTRPLLSRARARRQMLGWVYYRRAGCALLNGQWLRGARDLCIAFCLRPLHVSSRLPQQLMPCRPEVRRGITPAEAAVLAAYNLHN